MLRHRKNQGPEAPSLSKGHGWKDALESLSGIVYDLHYFNYVWVTVWVCAHECATCRGWRSQVLKLKFRRLWGSPCGWWELNLEAVLWKLCFGSYAKAASLPSHCHHLCNPISLYCRLESTALSLKGHWQEPTTGSTQGNSKTCVI